MNRSIRYLLILLTLLFRLPELRAQVLINEWSASNLNVIADNYGAYDDWIELYNTSSSSVNLAGYHLSNNKLIPLKWTLTSGTIPGNGFLLIFASGMNQISGGYYHANFTLTQTKTEQLVLSDPSGVIIDSLTLRPAQANQSRGRTTDAGATWGVFPVPTPGTTNSSSTAMQNYATKPSMNLAAGFYTGSATVTITSPDPGVSIYYTTNGSTPSTSSTLYTAPVSLTATTVLRARAFSSNPAVPPSFVASNTFFISVSHTIPVVSVFGDSLGDLLGGLQIYPQCGIQYFDRAKQLKAEAYGTCNKHGNDSWFYAQRGIDFGAYDEYGYSYALNHKIFHRKNRKSFQHVLLKAAANDNYPCEPHSAHIRDAYVQTLSQQCNLHLDERTWEPIILYANGQYWGVYDIREKVNDADFTSYYYGQSKDSLEFNETWGGTWAAYGGNQSLTDWGTIVSYVTSNNMAVQANYNHVDSIINIKSFADYFIINSYVVCSDWLSWNTEWWRGMNPAGREKKWRYCMWDLDATFGHYINYTGIPSQLPSADPCYAQTLQNPGGEGHTDILNALMNNPGFKQYYLTRSIDLMNSGLSCPKMISLLDSMIAQIAPEMPGQVAKWGGSVAEWQADVDTMKMFINQRCTAIQHGMDSCYSLTGPYDLLVDVLPAGAGTVNLNSLHLTNFSWNGTYYGGIPLGMRAAPVSPNYTFDHWELTNTFGPSGTNDSINFLLSHPDHVIAHFRENEEYYVPTGFSPNGDGQNDVLYVLGNSDVQFDFTVYDRWGQQVFHTTNKAIGWDGTLNGEQLNSSVFAYKLIIYASGGSKIKNGNITLIR